MGLDMYVTKAVKPNINASNVYELETLERQYTCFAATEDGTIPEDKKDLTPFLVKVHCLAAYYDMDKIAKAYNLPNDISCAGIGLNSILFIGGNGDNQKSISITHKELKNYTCKKEKIFYITKLDDVAYWRKEYALDDALSEYFLKARNIIIENGGFYKLTKAAIKIIEQYDKRCIAFDEMSNLFYHNSY